MTIDPQVEAIAWTFLFDMCIFLAELLVFFCIRNKRDKGNVLLNWVEPQNEAFRVFEPTDLRPSMQKELERESKTLKAREDQIREDYDLTNDARKQVEQAINQTMEMAGYDKPPTKTQVTVSPVD